jgi:hypothetical protein
MATKDKNGLLDFVAGKQKNPGNKWDKYMIEKRGLASV